MTRTYKVNLVHESWLTYLRVRHHQPIIIVRSFLVSMSTRNASGRQSVTKAKVVLLGEGAVGKTSIVLRYFENKFNDKHEQTLQV